MAKIDFTQIRVYKDIAKTVAEVKDLREHIANELYERGQGIGFHALALKIYNSTSEIELDDREYKLLLSYAEQLCTPAIIDAIRSYGETSEEA